MQKDREPGAEESSRLPPGWPVLVTGAGGFVGGHVARELARNGYQVRAFTRRAPIIEPGDPPIEWVRGDLCSSNDLVRVVQGVQGVVHAGGWVSLGTDPRRLSQPVNVEATRELLDCCEGAGVERFVYTSTLWTTAAGTPDQPAAETTPWNLNAICSPYSETKREAERLVLERQGPGMRTTVICPGMVVGAGDHRPSSTGLLLKMARTQAVILPRGGLPLIDAQVLAQAHRKILEAGRGGRRYVVAGPYFSYQEMARLVGRLTGRPRYIIPIPDWCEPWLCPISERLGHRLGDRVENLSGAAVAGGFLRLHVSGALADAEFQLRHPPAIRSIFEALNDHQRSGRAPWLKELNAPGLGVEPILEGA